MNILAIDTSSSMISVALRYQGQVFEYAISAGFQHAQLLLPGIDYLFHSTCVPRESLDLIACASGPGSFTGLRIGMSSARGISLALNIPLILLPSLPLYAQGLQARRVLSVLDARKGRFYVAMANEHGELISDEYDADLQGILRLLDKEKSVCDILLSGPGAPLLFEQLRDKKSIILDAYARRPRATMMIVTAEKKWREGGTCADQEGPHYLRESDAVQNQA